MKLLLVSFVYAHMHMSTPPPTFNNPGDLNAPTSTGCTLFSGDPGGLAASVRKFDATQGSRPLRDFAEECYKQSGRGKVCGDTTLNSVVEIKDGKVEITVTADHAGPSAIYLDDLELHKNTGIQQNTVRSHDFGSKLSCNKPGGCKLRFVQVSLQANAPEIYDNCVMIKGNVGGAPPPQPPVTPPPFNPGNPDTTTGTQEQGVMTCGNNGISGKIGDKEFVLPCTAGGKCRIIATCDYELMFKNPQNFKMQ